MIEPWGAVFDVQGLEVPVDVDRDYRIVFDVATSTPEPGQVNPAIVAISGRKRNGGSGGSVLLYARTGVDQLSAPSLLEV